MSVEPKKIPGNAGNSNGCGLGAVGCFLVIPGLLCIMAAMPILKSRFSRGTGMHSSAHSRMLEGHGDSFEDAPHVHLAPGEEPPEPRRVPDRFQPPTPGAKSPAVWGSQGTPPPSSKHSPAGMYQVRIDVNTFACGADVRYQVPQLLPIVHKNTKGFKRLVHMRPGQTLELSLATRDCTLDNCVAIARVSTLFAGKDTPTGDEISAQGPRGNAKLKLVLPENPPVPTPQ